MFPRKESIKENHTHAEHIFSYLTKQRCHQKTKTSLPTHSPKDHRETLQMTRGNRNNSSACQLGFSGISGQPANLPRSRELLSLSPNLNLSPVELAEFTWNHFLICSLEHAQPPWLNLRFSGPDNFNKKMINLLFIYWGKGRCGITYSQCNCWNYFQMVLKSGPIYMQWVRRYALEYDIPGILNS